MRDLSFFKMCELILKLDITKHHAMKTAHTPTHGIAFSAEL